MGQRLSSTNANQRSVLGLWDEYANQRMLLWNCVTRTFWKQRKKRKGLKEGKGRCSKILEKGVLSLIILKAVLNPLIPTRTWNLAKIEIKSEWRRFMPKEKKWRKKWGRKGKGDDWKYKDKKTTVSIGQWVYSPLYGDNWYAERQILQIVK